jgi:hypothetical protein
MKPVRRWISWAESPSTSLMRLISAHCCTPITHSSSHGPTGPSKGQDPAGRTAPAPRWVTFQPAQAGQYSGGAYTCPRQVRPSRVGSVVHYRVPNRVPDCPNLARSRRTLAQVNALDNADQQLQEGILVLCKRRMGGLGSRHTDASGSRFHRRCAGGFGGWYYRRYRRFSRTTQHSASGCSSSAGRRHVRISRASTGRSQADVAGRCGRVALARFRAGAR